MMMPNSGPIVAPMRRRSWPRAIHDANVQHQRDARRDIAAVLEVDDEQDTFEQSKAGVTKFATPLMPSGVTANVRAASMARDQLSNFDRDLLRMNQHFAVDRVRGDRRDAGDKREQHEVDGQSPQVALAHCVPKLRTVPGWSARVAWRMRIPSRRGQIRGLASPPNIIVRRDIVGQWRALVTRDVQAEETFQTRRTIAAATSARPSWHS